MSDSDCTPPRPGQTIQPYQFEPDVEADDVFNPIDEDRMVKIYVQVKKNLSTLLDRAVVVNLIAERHDHVAYQHC